MFRKCGNCGTFRWSWPADVNTCDRNCGVTSKRVSPGDTPCRSWRWYVIDEFLIPFGMVIVYLVFIASLIAGLVGMFKR